MGVEYRISSRTISRHLKWIGLNELICCRCGKEIFSGDWIHRSNCGHSNARLEQGARRHHPRDSRFYHLSCFEGLFV